MEWRRIFFPTHTREHGASMARKHARSTINSRDLQTTYEKRHDEGGKSDDDTEKEAEKKLEFPP